MAFLFQKTDHNYHNSFKCAFQAYCRTELHFANSVTLTADSLSREIGLIDPDNDRQMFLEDNQQAFLPEKKISQIKHSEDSVRNSTFCILLNFISFAFCRILNPSLFLYHISNNFINPHQSIFLSNVKRTLLGPFAF